MRHLPAVLAVLVAGCSGPIPVYLGTDTHQAPVVQPPMEVKRVLDEGFGYWGLTYELVGRNGLGAYGSIDLTVVDVGDDQPVRGSHRKEAPCRHDVWVDRDGVALAHELGHAWGLIEHSDDPENVMYPTADEGAELTDAQLDKAERGIANFLACLDGA